MAAEGALMYLAMAALLVVPFWRLLPRHGIAQWYALLALIPVGAVILLWILAFRDSFALRDRA